MNRQIPLSPLQVVIVGGIGNEVFFSVIVGMFTARAVPALTCAVFTSELVLSRLLI